MSKVSQTAGSSYILCPCFRGHSSTDIHCDGPTSDCFMAWKFTTKAAMKQHESIFCKAKYDYCEWYRTLEEMRDDDD